MDQAGGQQKGTCFLFCFVLDFLGDLSFMCMCVSLCEYVFIPYVQESMDVERLSDPLSLDCHTQL